MEEDVRIGQVFKNAGLITTPQLEEALRKQERMQPRLLIGEVLIELGYLKAGQNEPRVGEYLLHSHQINRAQLDEALRLQEQDRAKFIGEILVNLGHIDRAAFVGVLNSQHHYKLNRQRLELGHE